MSNEDNEGVFDFSTVECPKQYYCRALQCYEYLWGDLKCFWLPKEGWDVGKIDQKNKDLLDSLPKPTEDKGIVYAISTCARGGTWEKQYVGSCEYLRKRIREHLIKCSSSTDSCLESIKDAVGSGQNIAISWIEIRPAFVYISVEQMIIGFEKTKNISALPWNKLPGDRK